ncbi:HD domain-containing protein [Candidatus Peregrinibacteria bacterium]|jgi:hypothetical protein|nr:HD domain-containing protein [Candidatus Peregrinibacteria bacterium]
MIKISDISIEKLRNGEFQDELPEFFELESCIEDNRWHSDESVFTHTLKVLEELGILLGTVNDRVSSYLGQTVEIYSRKDLLFLGALFHDIAKAETLTEEEGVTSCPEHEEMGSKKVRRILDRFDLSEEEKTIVTNIVRYHGEIHGILSPENDEIENQLTEFRSRHQEIFTELILLGMSDTFGSQLEDNHPEDYNFRRDSYERIIDNPC